MMLLLGLVLLCLLLSALAAGSETGLYTIHPLRLRLRAEAGDPRARALQKLFLEPTRVVVTVLVIVNLVEMVASYAGQHLLIALGFESPELLSLVLLTPLFFVFGEALPKNVFRIEADRLMPRLHGVLAFLMRVLRPVTLLVEALLRLPGLRAGEERKLDVFSRPGLTDALSGPIAEDILSATQRSLAGNVVAAAAGSLRHALRPLQTLPYVRPEDVREEVSAVARASGERRLLVRDGAAVLGMIHLYDVLLHRDPGVRVRAVLRAMAEVDVEESVLGAVIRLKEAGQQLALVRDRARGGEVVGVVGLRDLLDEIVGEFRRW